MITFLTRLLLGLLHLSWRIPNSFQKICDFRSVDNFFKKITLTCNDNSKCVHLPNTTMNKRIFFHDSIIATSSYAWFEFSRFHREGRPSHLSPFLNLSKQQPKAQVVGHWLRHLLLEVFSNPVKYHHRARAMLLPSFSLLLVVLPSIEYLLLSKHLKRILPKQYWEP